MGRIQAGFLLTLGEVLQYCDRELWSTALYLPRDEKWTLETRCMVLDPDSAATDEDEEPEMARRAGLTYALGVQDVLGIVENARAQVAEAGPGELLTAFMYYYDHDAFVVFGESDKR